MTKQYTYNEITYRFNPRNRAWDFHVSPHNFTLIQRCNGSESAHKVAHIVSGSVRRAKGQFAGLDGLARANINQVLQSA